MRASVILVVASVMLMASNKTFAQHEDVNPQTLPAQIAAQELVVQAEPNNHDWQAWLRLAVLLQDAGSYRESESAYRQTISLLRAPDPLIVADVFDHMATMYLASGQLAKADPIMRHALAIREHEHDQLGTGVSHMHLAMLLLDQHDLRSAEAEAQSAVSLLVPEYAHLPATSSATPEEKMTALIDLAIVQCTSGGSETAVAALQDALQIAHANYPDTSLAVGHIEYLLGYAYWKSGDPKDADELMSRGVHKLATVITWNHPTYLKMLQQYREYLLETKQREKAREITAQIEKLDNSKNTFTVAAGSVATAQTLPR